MRKKAISFISLLLATALIVESPVIAFAEENIAKGQEVDGADATKEDVAEGQESDDADATETDATEEDTSEAVITPKTTEYSSTSITSDGLTTSVKGLSDDNYKQILTDFADNIPDAIKNDTPYKEEDQSLPDAEKYSTHVPETFDEGYDGLLCWASSATNNLWTSGYAEAAVNPITGQNFQSEDEVFDYFRKSFADYGGEADGALEYFMNGTYKYEGSRIAAQLRDNAPAGGLLKSEYESADVKTIYQEDTADILTPINDLIDTSASAFMRFWSDAEQLFNGGAHLVAIVGLTKDDSATDYTQKYKGIILADSDNDAVLQDETSTLPPEEKARLAAEAINSYTFYPLSWEILGSRGYWVVNKYLGSVDKAALDHIVLIRDRNPVPPKDDPAPEATSKAPDTTAESSTETDSSEDYLNSVYATIKAAMIKNNQLVYSPTESVYSPSVSQNFELYINTLPANLISIHLDGQLISGNSSFYKIVYLPNGMFKLILSKDVCTTLAEGKHVLKLSFSDGTIVDMIIEVR